jgi:hypothetical protein
MNDELRRHLDGDLPMDSLGDEARGEAEAWERLLDAFRVETPAVQAPPWLESKVMAEIEALPEPGTIRRIFAWLFSPRPVRISPITMGLATAALVTVLLIPARGFLPSSHGLEEGPGLAVPAGLPSGEEAVVYVQFTLEAPGASSVAVAGDFDSWEGSYALSDPDGDGVWSGRFPVKPGLHAYMFLVDGSTWMTDPRADRYAEDGFGNRNAILAVTVPTA